MIKENLFFLTEFLREFKTTGACLPTSRWAAQALIAPLTEPNRPPKKILELGPGTGSVTVPIVSQLRKGDLLTICEINPRFMKALKEKLEAIPAFHKVRDQVEFFEGPAQELPEKGTYDMIVCALPFLNFELSLVQDIFAKLRKVSTPDTLMLVFRLVCAAWIVGLKLVAWTVLGAKRLPTPAICKVHFWIGNLQHHCEWESQQQKTTLFVRAQSFIQIIVLRYPIRFVGREFRSTVLHGRFGDF